MYTVFIGVVMIQTWHHIFVADQIFIYIYIFIKVGCHSVTAGRFSWHQSRTSTEK